MAPMRIYLQWHGDGDPADEGEIDEAAVTWSRYREFEHDIRYTRTDIFMDAIARAEAAERHVQELKAQLAQAWRPVTEPPEKNETITLLRQYTPQHGYEYQLAIWESVKENLWKGTTESDPGGYWFTADNEGDEIDIDDWQEWQLLMRFPPPTGGNSIEFWVDDNDEWHVESPANAG